MPQIYKVTCNANGKAYIGKNLLGFDKQFPGERFFKESHCKELKDDVHKFGLDQFTVTILLDAKLSDDDELLELKQFYIWKHRTFSPNGYNKSVGVKKMASLGEPNPYRQILIEREENRFRKKLYDSNICLIEQDKEIYHLKKEIKRLNEELGKYSEMRK